MSPSRLACLGLLTLAACATAPKAPSAESAPPAYGTTPESAVRIGGGPSGERAYLRALRGPRGEDVLVRRLGSCCEFETPNGIGGWGMLDVFEVMYDGMDVPVRLYLNMYDGEPVRAPQGFVLEDTRAPQGPEESPEVIEL
ncbi:hypothetical protein P2318_00960 [Myxococcaceae bacterium GXIMD 01537]